MKRIFSVVFSGFMLCSVQGYAQPPVDPTQGYTISPSVVNLPVNPGDSMPPKPRLRRQPIYIDIYTSAGTMNGSTDLTESFSLRTFQFNIGAGAALNLNRYLAIRTEINAGKLREADTLNRSEKLSKRNLSYRTPMTEVSAGVEFYPFMLLSLKYRYKEPLVKPYVVGGAGIFRFDPEAELNGTWYRLHPLSTEGQGFPTHPTRKPYKLRGVSYQTGIGARYDFDRSFNLKFEFLYRFTNTDYLDDVGTTYIDRADFFRYLPNLQDATIASKLFKRQYRPGNILSTGELRGSNRRNDGFYTFNVKLVFNIGKRYIYTAQDKAKGSLK